MIAAEVRRRLGFGATVGQKIADGSLSVATVYPVWWGKTSGETAVIGCPSSLWATSSELEAGGIPAAALRRWGWAVDRRQDVESRIAFQRQLHCAWQERFAGERSNNPIAQPIVWPADAATGYVLAADEDLWTLSTWRPGQPPSPQQLAEVTRPVAECLAKLHFLGAATGRLETSEGWMRRRGALLRLRQSLASMPSSRVGDAVAIDATAALFRYVDGAGFPADLALCEQQLVRSLPCGWIFGDAHCDNWLVQQPREQDAEWRVSGVVDFAAARCDWLGWDLVRWATSLPAGPHESLSADWFAAYRLHWRDLIVQQPGDIKPSAKFADEVLESIDWLEQPAVWRQMLRLQRALIAANWLGWSAEGRFPPSVAAAKLQAWVAALIPLT